MVQKRSIDELLKGGFLKKGDDPSLQVSWIPMGLPKIDDILGGGLPTGRMIGTYGPESTGKTLLAQYAAVAVQKSSHPLVLYMDMERSYDEDWWKQSGVDTEKLLVSTPTTAEQATDIMRAMLIGSTDLGLIVMDSIAAMTPEPETDPERSSSDKTIGLQARAITMMYRQILPLLGQCIFLATNQMRDSVGQYDELASLPGGRAQRHYSHIILRTRREQWITEKVGTQTVRKGFYMEVMSKKNKLATTADGASITLPFMYTGQIDLITSYIEEARAKGVILLNGAYYKAAGQSFLGMQKLREFYQESPEELEMLKTQLTL